MENSDGTIEFLPIKLCKAKQNSEKIRLNLDIVQYHPSIN